MSEFFLVRVNSPTAPEHLVDAHAAGGVFLNARGRPCDAERAARFESGALAQAVLQASLAPLRARYGDELSLEVDSQTASGAEDAQRIANDSNAARDWLVSLPLA